MGITQILPYCQIHAKNRNSSESQDVAADTVGIGQWNHMAATFDGSTATIYINGASAASAARTMSTNTTESLLIGLRCISGACAGAYFNGPIQDVAYYNYALTPPQILTHYNAGIGTYGGVCSTSSGFGDSTRNFIGGLFDGSTASLFVNGRQECSVSSVAQKLSSASTNFTAGATSTGTKGWVGYLADLK